MAGWPGSARGRLLGLVKGGVDGGEHVACGGQRPATRVPEDSAAVELGERFADAFDGGLGLLDACEVPEVPDAAKGISSSCPPDGDEGGVRDEGSAVADVPLGDCAGVGGELGLGGLDSAAWAR